MLLTFRKLCGFRGLVRRLRVYHRQILTLVAVFLVLDSFLLVYTRPSTQRPPIRTLAQQGEAGNVTVFIASIHRNTEEVLRAAWNDAVVHLVSTLGAENVYLSVVESGSQDKSKEALTELKRRLDELGASSTISLGATVDEQLKELGARPDLTGERKEGWIWNAADGQYDLRRIPYLARVRNHAMEPMKTLAAQGRRFDKILWINDVVFDSEDVLGLLSTRNGQYAAACSMDFKLYPRYYDTFALRDDQGQKTSSYYFPWFLSRTARTSTWRGEPIKVFSCWNGMVAFDSKPFYADPPLKFRGIADSLADSHLEASECCLVHADNPLSSEPDKGVWLNPNVRVGYNIPVYLETKGGRFPGAGAAVVGAWVNRLWWIKVKLQLYSENWTVQFRLNKWRSEALAGQPARLEPGAPCLINEMQIMWQNGWRHL